MYTCSDGQTRAQTGSVPTDKKFTGQILDASTGLYYYGARYHDAAIGRFLQPDSIVPRAGDPQALNRYSYTLNNPLRFTDPGGHDPLDQDWEQAFSAAHGRPPTDMDKLARLASLLSGRPWTDADWQQYSMMVQSGLINEWGVLKGTSGRLADRIKIASALVMLATSGNTGLEVYGFLTSEGTNIQFGGMEPIRQENASIGVGLLNSIFLTPSLKDKGAEIIAAVIAHEAYHVKAQTQAASGGSIFRWPFSKKEEVGAFAQEARVWEELRVTYRGSNGGWYDDILSAYKSNTLDLYVRSTDPYRQEWYYQIFQ